jgi:hypothetical protein
MFCRGAGCAFSAGVRVPLVGEAGSVILVVDRGVSVMVGDLDTFEVAGSESMEVEVPLSTAELS